MINEFVKPGHFYSVIPNITKKYNNTETKFIDLDFNESSHSQILSEIGEYLTVFDETFGVPNVSNLKENINERQLNLKYTLMNDAFGWMDRWMQEFFFIFYKKINLAK